MNLKIPRSGFINVFDYKSPNELANYLNYLSKNKTAYNNYFSWKRFVQFETYPRFQNHYFCHMCIQLQLEEYTGFKKSVIMDLANYWNKEKDCYSNPYNYKNKKLIKLKQRNVNKFNST